MNVVVVVLLVIGVGLIVPRTVVAFVLLYLWLFLVLSLLRAHVEYLYLMKACPMCSSSLFSS